MTPNTDGALLVALNEEGRRIGETHPRSTIPDAIVERIRDRHEYDLASYAALAEEFGLSFNTIRKICAYQRREQTAARWTYR